MPFTLAHPAAVLPLRRSRLVFSALVVGSLAPDFPYFFLLTERVSLGHSVEGLFRFCLPTGLAVLWVFHAVVKRPLVDLAPSYIRERISPADLVFHFGPWPRFLRILGSLLVGSITHILWDGFTHDHGYFVKHWALLRERVVELPHHPPVFKLLQLGCSGLGVAIIAWYAWRVWRKQKPLTDPVAPQLRPAWRAVIVVLIFCVVCVCGGVAGLEQLNQHHGWKSGVIEAVIHALVGLWVAVLVYSVLWRDIMPSARHKTLHCEVQDLEVSKHR